MKEIAVIGACCSRDVFNSKFIEDWRQKYNLLYYSFQTSIISMMSAPIPYSRMLLKENDSEWYEKIFERELNKNFLTDLKSLYPDNLLIDFYSDIFNGVLEIEDGKSYLSQRKKNQENNAVYHTLNISNEITPTANLKAYMELWQSAMERFLEWAKKNIPETAIIINRPYFVNRILYLDGHVGKYKNENCELYNDIYERMISFVKQHAPDVKILDMGDNYYIDPNYIFGGHG